MPWAALIQITLLKRGKGESEPELSIDSTPWLDGFTLETEETRVYANTAWKTN